MTPARLEKIEEIFYAALNREPDQVAQFLETACEGDELLRRKVEALLASRERVSSFIEKSAVGLAARIIKNGDTESLVGHTIGHYKICESIGAGGMGEVYVATDIVSGRKAALKLLPLRFTGDAERLKRFEREARAVVGLNHPNVVTVYEIGEDHSFHYIASELIEGETLRDRLARGRMPFAEALDVAIQVASALAAAHQAGIVHRDIKPENIMLRPDGYVKVLDFGIAKLAEQELPTSMPKDKALLLVETNLGSVLGTVRYMSPEQASGAPVDKITDIWSLGVVLYEMVTGHQPFTGDTAKQVMTSILEKEPPPLTRYIRHTSSEPQHIIGKALRKKRTERYQSANEMLQALKRFRHKLEVEAELKRAAAAHSWYRRGAFAALALVVAAALLLALPFYRERRLATSTAPPEKSIAVLPLQNLSEDKENAFFADGVQDELLSNLSKIKDLKVISRTSVMQYKSGTRRNLKEIAQQLGVGNVVEGSVRRSGDHVRVSVQLIDARMDRHLWGENYHRTRADSLALQGELATEIAAAVGATLSPQEKARVEAKPTNNLAAYDAYLRGRALVPGSWGYYYHEGDPDAAIRLFQEAVKLDPNFVLAWAYLSQAELFSYWSGFDQSPAHLAAVKSALDRALALDPNLPEVHIALGYYLSDEGDHTRALAEFRQAEKGLPNSAAVIGAIAGAQEGLGHWDEAIAELCRAIELDPRNVIASNNLALTYGQLRRFSEALATLDRVLAWAPTNARALVIKAEVFLGMGDLQAAEPLLENPDMPPLLRARCALFQRRYAAAIEILSRALANPTDRDKRNPTLLIDFGLSLALSQQRAGDVSAARATYQRAVQDSQRQLEKVTPGSSADAHAFLGLAYAGLGEAASAIGEGQKAIAITSKDAEGGPDEEAIMANIYALLGDADHAIPILKRLLQAPYGGGWDLTPATLRLDPIWDPIRNDPRFQELAAEKASLPEKSIAVLPLENLSDEKENAFFAAGIHDELLSNLSKIKDLKVISRTSVMQYKSGNPRNIREIGQQLGVAHVLEGSVRRAANRVKVSTQLIDARTDAHLWAQTYDRELSDIFSVESDVAKAIADQLRAKLTGQEEQAISAKPTDNVDAYDVYLRGLAFDARSVHIGFSPDLAAKAAGFYEQAVQLDSNFAHGWARLSRVNADLYFHGWLGTTSTQRDAAKRALEKAQKLEPNSPETVLALGYYQYWVLRDYGAAKTTFGRVSEMLPGSGEALAALARVMRREGKWNQSIAYFERALALDPRNVALLVDVAETYGLVRQFSAALKLCDRVLDISPNDPDVMAGKVSIYQAQGNLQGAAKLLSEIGGQKPSDLASFGNINQLRFERNYGEAVRLLQARLAQFHYDSQYSKAVDQVKLALIQRVAGDWAGAKVTAEQSRDILERLYRDESHMQWGRAEVAANLSRAYAVMGEKDSALKIAAHAIMLYPRAKDPKIGPGFEENLALIQTMFGENGQAISTLAQLLQTSYNSPLYGPPPITPALLRLDPLWDPIRNDPRFQELVAEKKP